MRGKDSFAAFEEMLLLAKQRKVGAGGGGVTARITGRDIGFWFGVGVLTKHSRRCCPCPEDRGKAPVLVLKQQHVVRI